LRQCSVGGGAEGLDIAIDILSHFGPETLDVFQRFLERDRTRWSDAPTTHVNDDVCYMLLRALARSNVPGQTKVGLIEECLNHGTTSIREAATHALADMGGEAAKELLRRATRDCDPLVQESACEALDNLNG
jgi:hypothetical protein